MPIERIRIAPIGESQRTIYLEISKETDLWITGRELDKTGDLIGRVHLIDKMAIHQRTPVEMNLHYGEFQTT
jgi:hypothetical protein